MLGNGLGITLGLIVGVFDVTSLGITVGTDDGELG